MIGPFSYRRFFIMAIWNGFHWMHFRHCLAGKTWMCSSYQLLANGGISEKWKMGLNFDQMHQVKKANNKKKQWQWVMLIKSYEYGSLIKSVSECCESSQFSLQSYWLITRNSVQVFFSFLFIFLSLGKESAGVSCSLVRIMLNDLS